MHINNIILLNQYKCFAIVNGTTESGSHTKSGVFAFCFGLHIGLQVIERKKARSIAAMKEVYVSARHYFGVNELLILSPNVVKLA